ncbi:MAG: CPBP family intramembrane metalloprotease, partial [Lentisphaeria bacterium]|nr:CPBP family intramembrane metalloprotease [Lentisphaeria bacterium]
EFLMLSALVILIVPVAEELLFRRILFAGLLRFGNKIAWLGTAGIFAAIHLYIAGLPGLFFIGLGFQWLYCRHKNLAASILSHGLLNGCTVLAVLLVRGV